MASVRKIHSSSVDWIEASADGQFVFTRSTQEAAICMWRVKGFETNNKADYLSIQANRDDVF